MRIKNDQFRARAALNESHEKFKAADDKIINQNQFSLTIKIHFLKLFINIVRSTFLLQPFYYLTTLCYFFVSIFSIILFKMYTIKQETAHFQFCRNIFRDNFGSSKL